MRDLLRVMASLLIGISSTSVVAANCVSLAADPATDPIEVSLPDEASNRFNLAIPRAYLIRDIVIPRDGRRGGITLMVNYPSGCSYHRSPREDGSGRKINDLSAGMTSQDVQVRVNLSASVSTPEFDEAYLNRLQSGFIELSERRFGLRTFVSKKCIGPDDHGADGSQDCLRRERFTGDREGDYPRVFLRCLGNCTASTRYRDTMLRYTFAKSRLSEWSVIDEFVRDFLDALHVEATATN